MQCQPNTRCFFLLVRFPEREVWWEGRGREMRACFCLRRQERRRRTGVKSVTARQITRPRLVRLVQGLEGGVHEDGDNRSSKLGVTRTCA